MQYSGQKGGELGLLDASTQERLRGGQAADFLCEDAHEFDLRIRSAVGRPGLEMIPHAFIGAQFRGVRGERLQVQPAAEQLLHGLAAMNPAIVQQHDEGAGDLAQQVGEECCDFSARDIVLIELTVQRAMAALRADGDIRDGRDAVSPASIPLAPHLPESRSALQGGRQICTRRAYRYG